MDIILTQMEENSFEYICITQMTPSKKFLLEKILLYLFSDLYYVKIQTIKVHHSINSKFPNPTKVIIWQDHLSHPGTSMMRIIIKTAWSCFKNQRILIS
jgi:hypothetical protein